jgi:hypothetical protein
MMPMSFQEIAALEEQRSIRSGRWFSLVRLAPAGWAALDPELQVLEVIVRSHLRRTDWVDRLREREIGAVLIGTTGKDALVPIARLREAIAWQMDIEVRIGWAPVGPEQRMTWREAWSWAGQLLVADATVPAAA